ncbi:MAG: hypothetical protein IK078_03275, partial [Lachnospiraceae bacterium]|nr:hypothetical protein [Lachnospiraceae bacterium]
MNKRQQKTQICNRLQRSGKSFLSVMLSLIMIFSGMYTGVPEMMVTAYANSTGGVYTEYIPIGYKENGNYVTPEETYEKLVTFNGMQWYIIEDNSTSFNSGTVTLLAAGYIGFSVFGNTTEYAGSTVKGFLTDYYSDHFSGVDSAILNHDGLGKLYLLSTEEAKTIANQFAVMCSNYDPSLPYEEREKTEGWWLRTPSGQTEMVAVGNNMSGVISESGDWIGKELCVRPALELNLEEVTFLPETMTFVLNSQVSHIHYYSYAANDNTITATCLRNGCTLPDQKATLTITANGGTYDEATAFGATVSDLNHIKGDAVIKYYHCNADGTRGTALEPVTTAPTDAGKYWAEITVGTATAHISYTIAKADPNVTAPRAEATYGQKLSDITLSNPEGNIEGSWTFVDPLSTSVGDAGEHTFKANFIPANTNYNELANVDVTITVNEANQSVTAPQAEATYGQTLGDITLVNPQNNIEGNWTWVDSSTSVGNVGEHKFKATFTPADTNYSVVSNVDITVIVNQADPNVTAPQMVSLKLTQIEGFNPPKSFVDSTNTEWTLAKAATNSTVGIPDPKTVQIVDCWNHKFPREGLSQDVYVYAVE